MYQDIKLALVHLGRLLIARVLSMKLGPKVLPMYVCMYVEV